MLFFLIIENGSYVVAHSLLQLILCVRKCAAGSSGTASLLTKISAHAGLILAVCLRLQNAQIQLLNYYVYLIGKPTIMNISPYNNNFSAFPGG